MQPQPETLPGSGQPEPINEPETGLFYNLLSFDHPLPEIEVSFTHLPSPDAYCFSTKQVPSGLIEDITESHRPEYVYTCFSKDDPGIKVKVRLADYPAVSCAWYTKCIREMLAPQTDYFKAGFLNGTQFWCSGGTDNQTADYSSHYRFTVRVQHDFSTRRPELVISFNGMGHILQKNLEELNTAGLDTRIIRTAAFRGRIYGWHHLPEAACYHPGEVYPVLNHEMAKSAGLAFPPVQHSNSYSVYCNLIHAFVEKYCGTAQFRAVIPHNGQFKMVAPEDTGRIDISSRKLLFGENQPDTDPFRGMKNYGPLKLPEGRHFRYFFISFEQDEKIVRRLQEDLFKKEGFIRLEQFTRLPLRCARENNIVIHRDEDPEEQVERRLKNLSLEEGVKYYAFYINPSPKAEQDEPGRRLCNRIKEMLLYRKISMQEVDSGKLNTNYGKAISNIGCAMVAKMGGVPWCMEGAEQQELVIGFGVYRRSNMLQPCMGSSVCSGPNGLFREFNAFPVANASAVAGAVMEAFCQYRQNQPHTERIIIHFYKRMTPSELEPLDKMLKELKLEIPVVVAGISHNLRKGAMVFDSSLVNAMPVDGTWTRCGATSYLLNINRRRNEAQQKVKQTLPLKIEFQCNREGYLNNAEVVDGTAEPDLHLRVDKLAIRAAVAPAGNHPLPGNDCLLPSLVPAENAAGARDEQCRGFCREAPSDSPRKKAPSGSPGGEKEREADFFGDMV